MLYQQQKSVDIEQKNTSLIITINFKDYFHEIKSKVTIDIDSKVILGAEAQMLAVPWDLCYEILPKMEGLVGLRIEKGIKEKVYKLLGGAKGCVHLVDLTIDSITAVVRLLDFFQMPEELPYKEKMKKIREINKGVCHTYSSIERNPKLLKENYQSQID